MRVRLVLALGGVSACAAVTGLSEYRIVEESGAIEAGSDGAPATDAVTLPPSDAGVDAACADPVAPPAVVTAVRVTRGAITVDGLTSDWPCTMSVGFDKTTAQGSLHDNDAHAEVGVAWSEDGVYFRVRSVSGRPPVAVVNDDHIFWNDAVELYVGTGRAPDGLYTANDIQLIVDYLNRIGTYRQNLPVDAGANAILTKTSQDDVSFTVEAFISSPVLGRTPLTSGDYGFDVMLDQGRDAGTQNAFWLYSIADASAPKGSCANANTATPSCDTYGWGTLRLLP